MNRIVLASMAALVGASAFAAPVTYNLDPATPTRALKPTTWAACRYGEANSTALPAKSCTTRTRKSGTIDVTVDMSSIDFGMPKLNEHAKSAEIFDVAKYPTATYSGKFTKFNGASPTEAQGP